MKIIKKKINNCKICNSKKSKFVKTNNKNKQSNKDVVDTFINNLLFETHLLEIYYKKPFQNLDKSLKNKKTKTNIKIEFCGLSTKYDQTIVKSEKSINVFDNACEKHDLAHKNKDSKTRNTIDKKLYEAAGKYFKKPYLRTLDKVDANIVKVTIKLIKK